MLVKSPPPLEVAGGAVKSEEGGQDGGGKIDGGKGAEVVVGVADGAGAEVKREGVGLLKMLVGRGNELWNKD